MHSHGGWGYTYSEDQLEEALDRHGQLTQTLWEGTYSALRKVGESYQGTLIEDGQELASHESTDLRQVLRRLDDAIRKAAPEDWSREG